MLMLMLCCDTTTTITTRPVQDSECGQLQPGTRVVVLARWKDRSEQKYYDAEIVSAHRKEHGSGNTTDNKQLPQVAV